MIKMFKKNCSGQVSMEFIITIIFISSIFVFSLFLFQNRTMINQNYSDQWNAREIANRLARNINNVYLMDENAIVTEHFFWHDDLKSFELGSNVVRAYYNNDFFVDAPILAIVESNISDLNGEIVFKKQESKVIISYD